MINSKNLRTITDMRKDADGLLKLAEQTKKPVGILKNNKLKAYLVDVNFLERLEELIEDREDTVTVEERLINSTPDDFVDFEEYWDEADLPKS